MHLSRRVPALAAALLLSACALLPALAEASNNVTLSNSSNGSSVTVTRGSTVWVDLKGDVGAGTELLWSLPTVSNASVLRPRSESQVRADTRAVYVSAHTGSATISSHEACRVTAPGHACPLFILLWHAEVTVRP